jgi:hypothetical protein
MGTEFARALAVRCHIGQLNFPAEMASTLSGFTTKANVSVA